MKYLQTVDNHEILREIALITTENIDMIMLQEIFV